MGLVSGRDDVCHLKIIILEFDDVWSLAIDREGIIWTGTLDGLSRFDGKTFTPFALPPSEPDTTRGVSNAEIVHSIMQDRQGKMWFGTNGGAYAYDPASGDLSHISEREGL
jgi:ligand-binding sensor domain-containing protein